MELQRVLAAVVLLVSNNDWLCCGARSKQSTSTDMTAASGDGTDSNPKDYTDMNFYVSGAIGARAAYGALGGGGNYAS